MCHSEIVELIFESDSIRRELKKRDVMMIRQAQMATNERTIDKRLKIHREQKLLRGERLRVSKEVSFAFKCPTIQN